jgi:hypothetical protein
MGRIFVRRRFFASLALAAAVITGSAGCTLNAEIANLQPYDPSDGVSTNVGDLALRNILLIKNDRGDANLVMTVVNNSGENVSLNVQFEGARSRITESLVISGFPARTRIGDVPEDGIVLRSPGLVLGGLFSLYFEYGDFPGEQVLVPVLDGSLAEYELLVP